MNIFALALAPGDGVDAMIHITMTSGRENDCQLASVLNSVT